MVHNFRVDLGTSWDHFGVVVRLFWDSSWDHVEIILAPFWCHHGGTLGSLLKTFVQTHLFLKSHGKHPRRLFDEKEQPR